MGFRPSSGVLSGAQTCSWDAERNGISGLSCYRLFVVCLVDLSFSFKLSNSISLHRAVSRCKKVSVRIANTLVRAEGMSDPVKIFLASSLFTVQNLVVVSCSVCTHAGGHENFLRSWAPHPLI